ncbi:hypothetical protein HPB47_004910, partial [Ixodes persulcatus]
MADNVSDMKKLLIGCEEEAAWLRLQFNANKSSVVLFSRQGEGLEPLIIQNTALSLSDFHTRFHLKLDRGRSYRPVQPIKDHDRATSP